MPLPLYRLYQNGQFGTLYLHRLLVYGAKRPVRQCIARYMGSANQLLQCAVRLSIWWRWGELKVGYRGSQWPEEDGLPRPPAWDYNVGWA
jgi:hypothetical protein